jgi:hypothetical protein
MYNFKKRLKAKNALVKSVFSLFLFTYNTPLYAQTWEHNISKDFEFSIQDMWGESGLYEAKFVLSNAKTAFVKTIEIDDNNIGKLIFPDEFNQTRGKFNKDTITLFNWYIEVKKQKVAFGKVVYNPSPNELLQLFKYDFIDFKKKEVVWGDVVDGFRWNDKKGENILLRSVVSDIKTNSIHLYIYHFLKEDKEFKQVRKLTDYVKNCDLDMFSSHNIESIELTDIDKDTIGEVSFSYTNDCSCLEDSLAITTKLMLITKGEKYAIRGIVYSKKNDVLSEYELGGNLKKNDLYRRFLIKKWKKLTGEEKTIYN